MRRALPLLLLMVASLSACSYSSDFIVANESGAPIEVYYTLKVWPSPQGHCSPLGKKDVETFDDSDAPWRELRTNEYLCDEGTRGVRVTLQPKEALVVARMHNYSGHEKESDEWFNIESIRVAGVNGSVQYSGRMARTQFVEQDRQTFVIAYR